MRSVTFDDGILVYMDGFDPWADGWSYVDDNEERRQ